MYGYDYIYDSNENMIMTIRVNPTSPCRQYGESIDGCGSKADFDCHCPIPLLEGERVLRDFISALCALFCIFMPVFKAQADPTVTPAKTIEAFSARSLPPEKLYAIRAIGSNILQAKRNTVDNPTDTGQLTKLRTLVDQLIAVESTSSSVISLNLSGNSTNTQAAEPADLVKQREDLRTAARDASGQLHYRASSLGSQAKSVASADGSRSAGFPVGQQRGKLFERWANQLDEALADGNPNRLAQLYALRNQIQAKHNGVIDTPTTPATPTLQAMPWIPPASASSAQKSPRKDHRNHSTKN